MTMKASSAPPACLLFLIAASVMLTAVSLSEVHSAAVLHLERNNHSLSLDQLAARDKARHARILRGSRDHGGIDSCVRSFPVYGSADPDLFGIYYTKVKLGSPPQEFSLQIDTGSDLLWVNAKSCANCPQKSRFGIPLSFFDAANSSTGKPISCSNKACTNGCTETGMCRYEITYEDGDVTLGAYVIDRINLDVIRPDSTVSTSSADIVFGVSTDQSGALGDSTLAVDGMFGLGQGPISPISQLSSRGLVPRVFSHCLKGEGLGGGTFVLGEVVVPGMIYTPLVPGQAHYNLYLESISVNGEVLPVDPAVFTTSPGRGTFVDSGSTLAYLVEEAYEPFITAMTAVVSQSATPRRSGERQCYLVSSSVSQVFPVLSFNLANNASLVLKPADYLHESVLDVGGMWCIGIVKKRGQTILGDLVLKDKFFVYDLVHQRIGWTNYDCLKPANVSIPQQPSSSCSLGDMRFMLLLLAVSVLFSLDLLV